MPTLRYHRHAPSRRLIRRPRLPRRPASRRSGSRSRYLARRNPAEYAPLGAPVVDAMCGIGTTLVEAAT